MIEKVRRGYPMPTWPDDPAGPERHRDHVPTDERYTFNRYAIPRARVPEGTWSEAIALMDEAQLWLNEEDFVVAALKHYIAEQQAEALRRIGERKLRIDPGRVEVAPG
jgi:hypothetical protein